MNPASSSSSSSSAAALFDSIRAKRKAENDGNDKKPKEQIKDRELEVARIMVGAGALRIVAPPFNQLPLTDQQEKKSYFITSDLAHFMIHTVDSMIAYQTLLKRFFERICEISQKVLIPLDRIMPTERFEYLPNIQRLVETSPFPEYFKSKIITTHFGLVKKYISWETMKSLLRTHVYDRVVSGIANQEPSMYALPFKMDRHLCTFLNVPLDTRMTRAQAYTRVMTYIRENNLIIPETDTFKMDAKLSALFCGVYNEKKLTFIYSYLRMRFVYENAIQEYKTQFTNGDLRPFIVEESYVNEAGKLHGNMRKYDIHGKVIFETYYIDGVENGIRRTWHPNGMLRSYTKFIQGMKDGMSFLFNTDGELVVKILYKYGNAEKAVTNF